MSKQTTIKIYPGDTHLEAIDLAITYLSKVSGETITRKDYALMAVLSYTEAVGLKAKEMQRDYLAKMAELEEERLPLGEEKAPEEQGHDTNSEVVEPGPV